jgi:hypothetical protein
MLRLVNVTCVHLVSVTFRLDLKRPRIGLSFTSSFFLGAIPAPCKKVELVRRARLSDVQ